VAFARACRKVGVADFRFHDLRHTAASWMRMQGADIHTGSQLLGHKDLRMAARYRHLSPTFLGEAVRSLDGVFGEFCYPGVTAGCHMNKPLRRHLHQSWGGPLDRGRRPGRPLALTRALDSWSEERVRGDPRGQGVRPTEFRRHSGSWAYLSGIGRYRSQGAFGRRTAKPHRMDGVPKGIRTPVIAVKGRCPRPG
jgi:Phage integrase family